MKGKGATKDPQFDCVTLAQGLARYGARKPRHFRLLTCVHSALKCEDAAEKMELSENNIASFFGGAFKFSQMAQDQVTMRLPQSADDPTDLPAESLT